MTGSKNPPLDLANQFQLEQYKELRKEICQSIQYQHQILLAGFGAIAALAMFGARAESPWFGIFAGAAVPVAFLALASLWCFETNRMVRAGHFIADQVEVFFYHQEHQGEAASNMPSGSEVKEVPTHEVPAPVPRKRKEHADIRLRRDESAQSELDGLAPYWENWLRYQQQNGNAGKFVRRQDHVQRFLIVWIPCAVSLFAMVYCASNISRLLQNALYWVCAVVGVIVAWSVAATWLWLYEEIGAVTNLRDSIPKQSKQKNEDQETKQVEANTGKSPSWWRRIWMKLRTCLPSRLPNWVNKYRFKVAVFVVIGVCWFLALWGSHRLLASGVINVSSQRTNELTLQFGTNILRLDLISHLPRPNTNASLGGGAVGALPP